MSERVMAMLQRGLALHQRGQLHEAESIYRQVLAEDGENLDAMNLLGLVLQQSGRHAEARKLLNKAIGVGPDIAELHNTLGLALVGLGDRVGAMAAFGRAIELDAESADAQQNLAAALAESGLHDKAIPHLREVVRIAPKRAIGQFLLGKSLHLTGRLDEAIEPYRLAAEIEPAMTDAWTNLGVALLALNRNEEAAAAFEQLTKLRPDDAAGHYHVGLALDRAGEKEAAAERYKRAIALDPTYVQAINNLGVIRHFQCRMGEAIELHQAAIAARPAHASAHANLGLDYWAIGRIEEAMDAYRRTLELDPSDYRTHSNLLMAMHYGEPHDPQRIFDESVRWAEQHAQRFYPADARKLHRNDRSPGRRLRIGYVSSNFREHAVAIFFEPMIAQHNHQAFEIICYSDLQFDDAVTERIRSHADVWRQTRTLSDHELDELIRDDQIDILVDLNGHIAEHRLLVFARKPAPVQVTYLGYPDTTGMSVMDYRLTDAWHDRPGLTDRFHTEQLVRLPRSAWCYLPWTDVAVSEPPVLRSGLVTFGSLNNLAKVTPRAIDAWARILKQVPGSRMAMLVQNDRFAEGRLTALFAQSGIGKDRLVFHTQRPHKEYVELFSELDIALDTFPYNGHTTTLNATWMGAAVVTVAGETHVSRAGVSVLSTVGQFDLIAPDLDGYVRLAVELANDRSRLAELRRTLRPRMAACPLLDAAGFTANLEAEYRRMWQRWCAQSVGGRI